LATAHTSRIRICRITDLLRCKSVFPVRENHINTKGIKEQKLNQPTGVNYLLTINHHYYYPKAAVVAVDSAEQVSGMVIIIIMTWEIEELELLVPGTASYLQLDAGAGQCISIQHLCAPKEITNV